MADQALEHVSIDPPRLLVFALGTFNVLLLALLVVAVGYRDGWLLEALDGLNPALGLLAFAALWLLTWWAGARVSRGWSLEHLPPLPDIWARGILWGGVAGVIALLVPLLPALVYGLVQEGISAALPDHILAAVLYGFIACGFACVVGAAVGFALATIDRCVLAVAMRA